MARSMSILLSKPHELRSKHGAPCDRQGEASVQQRSYHSAAQRQSQGPSRSVPPRAVEQVERFGNHVQRRLGRWASDSTCIRRRARRYLLRRPDLAIHIIPVVICRGWHFLSLGLPSI